MRYSTQLHTSPHHAHKRHVLQYPWISTIIGLITFGFIGTALAILASHSSLNLQSLLGGFFVSLARVTVAYLIALVLAITIALAITVNSRVEAIFLPFFDVMQSFPSFILIPVLVSALSHEPELVIISVVMINTIWPILFTIIGAMKNRREDLEEAATIYGAVGARRFSAFTMPSLLPAIVTGSIIGWGNGWDLLIGAELLVSVNAGIGQYLGSLGAAHQNTMLAIGVVVLMFMLFIINKVVWLPLLREATKFQSDT